MRRRVPLVDPFTQRVVDVASATLESDTDTSIGFNLGVLAKPNDSLSLGFSYRHKVNAEFTGQGDFEQVPTGNPEVDLRVASVVPLGNQPLTTQLEFPAIASVRSPPALPSSSR